MLIWLISHSFIRGIQNALWSRFASSHLIIYPPSRVNTPLILNPVRKEVDRTKDVDFAMAAGRYKSFNQETEPEKYEPT